MKSSTGHQIDLGAKAFSYLRFSTAEQGAGDSFRRQTSLAEDWCKRYGLELDTELTFHDLGVSAYRGANAETGQLGAFLEAVREGIVPQGSYLLIESLDRLSRMKPRKAVKLLERVCEEGIALVTLSDGKIYTEDELDRDPFSFLMAFLTAIRANEESAIKAQRLKAAWAGKRLKAGERKLTAKAPSWLSLSTDRRTFTTIEEKAEVVRRIYQMTLDGVGQHSIATALNRDRVPTFNGGAYWQRSTIFKLLDTPAVIGTFVPHCIEHDAETGRKVRTPQTAIEGYFPAVVDEETYLAVRAMKSGNRAPSGTRLQSIIAGIAKCPVCEGSMRRVNKGVVSRSGNAKLVCSKAKAGAGCQYRSVDYPAVERAIVENASWIASQAPSRDTDLDAEVAAAESHLETVNHQIVDFHSEVTRVFHRELTHL